MDLRSDSPDDVADLLPQKCIVWGAKAKPPIFARIPGGFADRTVNGVRAGTWIRDDPWRWP
jgi:hypothetical protein